MPGTLPGYLPSNPGVGDRFFKYSNCIFTTPLASSFPLTDALQKITVLTQNNRL
nr:MAG TPA: hypothetical protein [Caudoviricetes sp.]